MKCLNCSKEIKKNNKYCDNKCQLSFQRKEYIRKWKLGEVSGGNVWGVSPIVKHYLMEKFGNKCVRCGWKEINPYTKHVPVEVEHLNGNGSDHNEENLILICPNCHSLTKSFRALNKGKGRHLKIKSLGKITYGKD